MNNDMEKRLNKYEPPKIELLHSKNNLRRELLNSKFYGSSKWLYKFSLKEIVLASSFSILLILVIIYASLDTRKRGLNETMDNIKTTYASFLTPNSTNYFDSQLRIYGTDNEFLNLKVAKWFNHNENKYSIILKDANSDEILDKIIIRDDKIYRMKNPKLQILNTRHSQEMLIIELAEDLIISKQFSSDSIYVHVKSGIGDQIDQFQENGLLVYNKNNAIGNEINFESTELNSMKVNNQLNFDKYLKDNPLDLLNELEGNSNIRFIESSYDSITGKTFDVLQIVNNILDSISTGINLRTANSFGYNDSIKKSKKNDTVKFFSYHYRTSNESTKTTDSSNIDTTREVKSIFINQESGKIEGVDYTLINSKKSVKLSSIRFTNHALQKRDDKIFDPSLNELEYSRDIKKEKKIIIKKFHYDP